MKSLSPEGNSPRHSQRQQSFFGSVSLLQSRDGKFIHIRAGQNLDFTNISIFNGAAGLVGANPDIQKVIVDLGLTQRIFDSGKALLMLLRNQLASPPNQQIVLINALPEFTHELSPYC